jgi:hypothetical protein
LQHSTTTTTTIMMTAVTPLLPLHRNPVAEDQALAAAINRHSTNEADLVRLEPISTLTPAKAVAPADASNSFSRAILADFTHEQGGSPIDVLNNTNTTITPIDFGVAELKAGAIATSADAGEHVFHLPHVSPASSVRDRASGMDPLNIERLGESCTPEDAFAALLDGVSPCRNSTRRCFDSPPRPPRTAAAQRPVAKPRASAPIVKAPRHSWYTASGFTALAADLPAAVERGTCYLRLTDDGAGGTYFVYQHGDDSTPVAVFKPGGEEVGAPENPRGNDSTEDDIRFEVFEPGTGYLREVLAYELDREGRAGVPQTMEATINGMRGSLQRFCPKMMQSWSTTPAKFDTAAVHAIAVFDIRVLNCDRHGGNLLVRKDAPELGMVPIDHGFILPEAWCDPDFEWALWPQAREAVGADLRDYVQRLDTDADVALVESRLGAGPAEVLGVTTRLLKIALQHGKAYTLRDLADFCRRPSLTEPSGLEKLMSSSRRGLDDGGDIDFEAVVVALRRQFP